MTPTTIIPVENQDDLILNDPDYDEEISNNNTPKSQVPQQPLNN